MDGQIIIKNDQQPSVQCFIKDLAERRESGMSHLEESPVKSNGSNGVVERGVQGMEGQVRALSLVLQGRIWRKFNARGKVVNFMPKYVSYLMNRSEVGKDGKVAYDRAKGKKPIVLGVEFGGKLLYKLSQQLSWKR